MRIFFAGLFFLLTLVSVFGQNDIDNQVSKGIELANNFQWDKSDEVFQKLIEQYPDDPRGYYFKSRNFVWAYLSNKSKADYNEFLRLSELAIEKAGSKLDANSNDLLSGFIAGASYNYRGVAFGKAESYVNAVWAFQKSNSYLKGVIEKDKNYYDAYLGLGIINIALSDIPSAFKWVLGVAGLSIDKNAGFNYLKSAAQNGKFLKTEAQYYLSQVCSDNLLDYNSSAEYLKKITTLYPQNTLFQYSYATLLMKQRKLVEAENILAKIIKPDTNKKFKQVISYANFSLGDIHYRKNEFAKAVQYYSKFLKTNSFTEYTGIANLRMGIAYEALNDRNSAIKCFERAQRGNQDFEEDVFAKRKGEVFRNRTIAETELRVLRGGNYVEAGEYQAAIDLLKDALQEIKTDKLKAEAYLYLCDALYETGQYKESLEQSKKIHGLNLQEEKWILPFCSFYEARAYAKTGDFSKAKGSLAGSKKQNSNDFEKKLNNLINNLSRIINH